MSQRKHGLKGLGLTLLALCGLMAFMVSSAQANWLVNGAELKVNKKVLAKAHTTGKLSVPALNIEFRCTTITPEGLELIGSSATASGKVNFTGCTAFQRSTGTEQKNCKPKEPIKAGGKAKLILHEGKNYVLFEPTTAGGKFTTIELSELCALAETSDVTGSLVTECGQLVSEKFVGEDCKVASVSHLIQPAPAALFSSDKLKFGENAATLEGIAAVELESKESWAGHV